MSAKKTAERIPTATEVLDELCQLQCGKPLDHCLVGSADPSQIIRALTGLRADLEAIGKGAESTEFFGENEEINCDRVIAAMTRTGSLDPFRFIPDNRQQMVCSTIEVLKVELICPLSSKRMIRDIPAQLTGHNLGLAALAVHVLPP